jgi:hypothetical protein
MSPLHFCRTVAGTVPERLAAERPVHGLDPSGLKSNGGPTKTIAVTVKPDARRQGLWTSAEYVRHIIYGLRAHDVPKNTCNA